MQKVVGSSPIIRSFQVPQHLLLLGSRDQRLPEEVVVSLSATPWDYPCG
jgi:hypothetical protein